MSPHFQYAVACAGCYEGVPAQVEDPNHDIHMYLSRLDGAKCFAFEGTSDLGEWFKDFEVGPHTPLTHTGLGPLHAGIASGVLLIFDQLRELAGDEPFDVTGHSKGAGEALIFAGLMSSIGKPPRRVRAFESPRVGTSVLRDALKDLDVVQTATRNSAGVDVVTRVPPEGLLAGWCDVRPPLELVVPDTLSLVQKHRIGAVLTAIAALPEAAPQELAA